MIDASRPAGDKIFDISQFEKFLHDKIKVDGRVGNLGDTIVIAQEPGGDGKIVVTAHAQFSGRYLKYLYALSLYYSFLFPPPRFVIRGGFAGMGD